MGMATLATKFALFQVLANGSRPIGRMSRSSSSKSGILDDIGARSVGGTKTTRSASRSTVGAGGIGITSGAIGASDTLTAGTSGTVDTRVKVGGDDGAWAAPHPKKTGEGAAVAEQVGVLDGDVHRKMYAMADGEDVDRVGDVARGPTVAIWWRKPTEAEQRLTTNISWSPRMLALYGWLGILKKPWSLSYSTVRISKKDPRHKLKLTAASMESKGLARASG
jgi:hypothetical protein